ncbi:hypothetical protein [Streptomyces sp. Isolate_45]|nr:hypothetical protein [Streptomyces sp. Isolate_45]MDA5279614.1 hypothetical protein [Streptomyces sp. Isolate_45]
MPSRSGRREEYPGAVSEGFVLADDAIFDSGAGHPGVAVGESGK